MIEGKVQSFPICHLPCTCRACGVHLLELMNPQDIIFNFYNYFSCTGSSLLCRVSLVVTSEVFSLVTVHGSLLVAFVTEHDSSLDVLLSATSWTTLWQIGGETVETSGDFIFLGSQITASGDCSHEIKRHLLLGGKL